MINTKEAERRQKERAAAVDSKIKDAQQKQSITVVAKQFKEFVNDKRYQCYAESLNRLLQMLEFQRNVLKNGTTSNDEYVRKGIEYDSKIELLKSILIMPEKFINEAKKIVGENDENV
mgnify:CR=1 FL=1